MLYLVALGCASLLVILTTAAIIRVLALRRRHRRKAHPRVTMEFRPQGGERDVRTVEGAKPEVRASRGF
jgi:hypothetical protein